MYRLGLVALVAFLFVLLPITMNPDVLLPWLINSAYRTLGSVGGLLACTVVLLLVWVAYFALLVTLREGLRQQYEVKRLVGPLFWELNRLMAMSGSETVELIRRSGNLLSVRADGEMYFLSESSRYGLLASLRVTPNEIVDTSQPYSRLLTYDVEALRVDIVVRTKQLRVELG